MNLRQTSQMNKGIKGKDYVSVSTNNQNKDNKRNENIIGKITNRALIINSSNFNLFKVERIKHIKYKINTKGRG